MEAKLTTKHKYTYYPQPGINKKPKHKSKPKIKLIKKGFAK